MFILSTSQNQQITTATEESNDKTATEERMDETEMEEATAMEVAKSTDATESTTTDATTDATESTTTTCDVMVNTDKDHFTERYVLY